ncbi:MAG: hypothetical protein VYB54_12655 [Pseudomonadota bacterium]|nr:hypothetical protein [Pseudomonadota bacterium]
MRAAAFWLSMVLACGAGGAAGASCHAVGVVDGQQGISLRGIEDLVLDEPRSRLILSVHDRDAETDPSRRAANGLFEVPLSAFDTADTVAARALVRSVDDITLRPHGIDLRANPDGSADLLVINHRVHRVAVDAAGRPGTAVERFRIAADGTLTHRSTIARRDLCPANDLSWSGPEEAIVSLDRLACSGWRRAVELALSQDHGALVRLDLVTGEMTRVAGDLPFPNGVAVADNHVAVALTRGARIEYRAPQGGALLSTVALPGGPDNISLGADGDLIVAVHPSLFAYALYLSPYAFWVRDAPTRILRVSGGACETLVDDPDGTGISGASVAVVAGDRIIAGAAFDAGLMVCDLPLRGAPCEP